MANVIYNSFKKNMDAGIDWDDNTASTVIKVMLVTSTYAPNIDTHAFKSSVTNEVTGTNYTAGGTALTGRTVTQDNTNNLGKYDGDNAVWTNSTITARGAVIYKDTTVASTSPLIAYIDFSTDQSSSTADFTISWSADGIFTIV